MPSPSADAAQSQSHGSFSLSQSHAHAIQSQSAISTAAAVAAMSGSFQQAQNQAVPHTSAAAPSNLSPIATATNAIAAVSVSASSGTKSKLSLATSNNNQSHSNSQGLSIQTMNAKAGTTTSLPVHHHVNMQQTSTLAGHSLPLSQASNQVQAPAYSSFALPQHLNYNSLSFHSYTYHRPPPDSTPQIFLNTPLRRGKWTNVSIICVYYERDRSKTGLILTLYCTSQPLIYRRKKNMPIQSSTHLKRVLSKDVKMDALFAHT